MIYVKDSLVYKRRFDLEPLNIECIWIEMQLNHARLLHTKVRLPVLYYI